MLKRLESLPLFLLLVSAAALAMYLPAVHALATGDHHVARSFFYSGTLTLFAVIFIAIPLSSRPETERGGLGNLLSLLAGFVALPLVLAVPFYEGLQTTRFLNAYFEMVSSLTTTGATLFPNVERLAPPLHLWRAEVGWLGGFLMWVAAAAILAPLNLGGFEVTASAEPGQGEVPLDRYERISDNRRLFRVTMQLFPIYTALTLVLWMLLLIAGEGPLVALIHAMSTLATSGITSLPALADSSAGRLGEVFIFAFLLFALSRLTFSSDTITTARQGIWNDPEFRVGISLVVGVPLVLFLRHWAASFDVNEMDDIGAALRALWGGFFTVLSFLSTTGFVSADWATAQGWSGLSTSGMILMGLSLVGGGVATTAGGVKLLRVYALYLNGLREMEKLVHPNSVGRAGGHTRRLRRKGAFIAWIFFMLMALSMTLTTLVLAGLGAGFQQAIVLSVATLSTTGPLIGIASEVPIVLVEMSSAAKLVLCAAMVVGRLETLAIIALFNPALWRD